MARRKVWAKHCKGCGRALLERESEVCEVCGSPLCDDCARGGGRCVTCVCGEEHRWDGDADVTEWPIDLGRIAETDNSEYVGILAGSEPDSQINDHFRALIRGILRGQQWKDECHLVKGEEKTE